MPTHERLEGQSPNIAIPQKILNGIATYSKGASNDASTERYAWEDVIESIKTENAQIIIKIISSNVGDTGALSRKSIDKLPDGSNGLNQFIKSNGIADMR